MLSNRLKSIATFVEKEDLVADIGCDHGLLSIYLYEEKLCKNIIASDINPKALSNAQKNIAKKNLKIETILSDGLNSLDLSSIDTLIISGMGTRTIINILNDESKLINIKKIIIQSNNDHELLRRSLNKRKFYLDDETIICDKNIYYVTMKFIKSSKRNSENELKYGIIKKENLFYYNYLIKKYENIMKKVPFEEFVIRSNIKSNINSLKNIIK